MLIKLQTVAAGKCAVIVLASAGLLSACATRNAAPPSPAKSASSVLWQSALPPVASAAGSSPALVPWQHRVFPGKKPGSYHAASIDGRTAIASESNASASMLRQAVRIEAAQLSSVKFSWKVPALIAGADLADRDNSDSPARIVLAFEGDRSKFSAKNAMVSELALTLTGEPLPYAMLMYVWNSNGDAGNIISSSRTDRIRKMVVESGPGGLGRWLEYERDVRADFVKAFGEEPGALVGVGIMSDTDNTRGQVRAWFGPVSLSNQPRGQLVGKNLPDSAPSGFPAVESGVPAFDPP